MHFHSVSGTLNYFCGRVTPPNLNLFLSWWVKSNASSHSLFLSFGSVPISGHKLPNMTALSSALRSCLWKEIQGESTCRAPMTMWHGASRLSINVGATNINNYVLQAYVRAAAVFNLVHNITNLSLVSGPKFWKCYDQSFHLAFTISSNKTFK